MLWRVYRLASSPDSSAEEQVMNALYEAHRAQRIQNRLDRKKKDGLPEHGGTGRQREEKNRKQQNRKREMEGN